MPENCGAEVNDRVLNAIKDEEIYEEEYKEDDRKAERKRLANKYPYEGEDEETKEEQPVTKHEIKQKIWKKFNRDFIPTKKSCLYWKQ